MKTMLVALAIGVVGPGTALGAGPARSPVVAQAKTDGGAMRKVGEARLLSVRGTVDAIDKEKQTVTLKGPTRSMILRVRDPKTLDAISVGDPVVGRFYESLMIEVKKPGEATPGVTGQQVAATSKPGEMPAGAIGQQVTVTATIVAVDKKAGTATIKGPEGDTVRMKARDPKNLDKVMAGDNVEITYTEALAISLDKFVRK